MSLTIHKSFDFSAKFFWVRDYAVCRISQHTHRASYSAAHEVGGDECFFDFGISVPCKRDPLRQGKYRLLFVGGKHADQEHCSDTRYGFTFRFAIRERVRNGLRKGKFFAEQQLVWRYLKGLAKLAKLASGRHVST